MIHTHLHANEKNRRISACYVLGGPATLVIDPASSTEENSNIISRKWVELSYGVLQISLVIEAQSLRVIDEHRESWWLRRHLCGVKQLYRNTSIDRRWLRVKGIGEELVYLSGC
jgi:hypothetical protein